MTVTERQPSARIQRKREQARERIIDAAVKEFAVRGYERTTMADVAAALDMTSAALYYYFKAKDELLFAALVAVLEALITCLDEAVGGAEPDPISRLRALVEAQVAYELTDAEIAPFINAHLYGPRYLVEALGAERQLSLRKLQKAILDRYVKTIEAGVKRRVFRSKDARATAFDILALAQYPAVWMHPKSEREIAAVARRQAECAMTLLQG
jgi:AcrR family transcriptional regulator